jgi:hypothetical protein
LIQFCDWSYAFVREFLEALSVLGLDRVYISARIGRDVVHRIKLTGLSTAISKAGHNIEGVPFDNVDFVIRSVRNIA